MIDELERLLEDIKATQSWLILLVGPHGSGKSKLLTECASRHGVKVLNVGVELAKSLSLTPVNERGMAAYSMLRAIAEAKLDGDLLLLDNLEVLFERTLKINPLDLIKRLAHSRRVVAVWPGESAGGRVVYGAIDHPEYRDYAVDGMVVLELQ